ncbi:hypothetical protein NMY22_g14100 [Coprinellus aureogranulatus]|nr:hypothetical protein NMY22_g14100 [Coprinellus aureogranulatus]
MSAKLAYQKPPVNLPDLPTELWGSILRFATQVPDTLEDLSMDRYSGGKLRAKRYREILVTKRYVVLVCRTWYALGTPFLYEHLYIPRLHGLDIIQKSLELPFAADAGTTLGHLTKRLDLTLPSDDPSEWQRSGVPVLWLLKRVPNVVNIRVDWQVLRGILQPRNLGYGDEIREALLNLERIDLAETFLVPVSSLASEYLAFIDRHPLLKHIDLIAVRMTHDITASDRTQTRTWPAVRELGFSPMDFVKSMSIFPAGAFPNLEKAVVLWTSRSPIENLGECLRAHGRWLKAILLAYDATTGGLGIMPDAIWYDVYPALEVLKECCPLLEELSFNGTEVGIPRHKPNGRPSAMMPTVTTLGIELGSYHRQFTKNACTEFLESALSWLGPSPLPNIRTIRLLSESNLLHMRRCHAKRLEKFMEECNSRGILVEDSFHCALNRPSG